MKKILSCFIAISLIFSLIVSLPSYAEESYVAIYDSDFSTCTSKEDAQNKLGTFWNAGGYVSLLGGNFTWDTNGINFVWPTFAQVTSKTALADYRFSTTMRTGEGQWVGIGIRESLSNAVIPNNDHSETIIGQSTQGIMFMLSGRTPNSASTVNFNIAIRTILGGTTDKVFSIPLPTTGYFMTNRDIVITDYDDIITFSATGQILSKIVIDRTKTNELGNYTSGEVFNGNNVSVGTFSDCNVPKTGMLGIFTRANNAIVKSLNIEQIFSDCNITSVTKVDDSKLSHYDLKTMDNVKVNFVSNKAQSANLVVAFYNNNKLLSVGIKPVNCSSGLNSQNIDISPVDAEGEVIVKAMLLDDNSIKPLARSYNAELTQLMVPNLSVSWRNAKLIVRDEVNWPNEFLSDFLLIKDKINRWHCIGIGGQASGGESFFHAVGNSLDERFTYVDRVYNNGTQSDRNMDWMWAPYAIFKDDNTCYMYYAHYFHNEGDPYDGAWQQERVLQSDGTLDNWTPLNHPDLVEGNIAFQETSDRDACIFFDDDLNQYMFYYAASSATESLINLRTSTDLIHWSQPTTVLAGPPAPEFRAPESPFIMKKFGLYYMFISGFDYGRCAVYASKNPYSFGDAQTAKIGEINAHAPEIVQENGKDYMASAAISLTYGSAPAYTDLTGVYIQELKWVPYEEAVWYGPPVVPTVPSSSKAYWNFESNVVDSVTGRYSDANLTGVTFASGRTGNAMVTTSSSTAQLGFSGLNLASNFTISFWMKKAAASGDYNVIIAKGAKDSGHFEVYVCPDGTLSFYQAELGIFNTGVVVTNNAWRHVAITYDGFTIKTYIDGAVANSASVSAVPYAETENLYIGSLNDKTYFFNGMIDELYVLDSALSASDVTNIMQNGYIMN